MAVNTKNSISHSTTQLFLDLYDITNDLIILGDGAASLVISVSAMNFGLLSENEQDATIYAYAALLNSLSFPVQIVIRSQPKDVTGYLKRIQDQEESTTNPIYKQKIKEYREFVESLVQDQNVLDKKFYIVIPLSAVEMGLTTQSVVPGAKSKPISSFEKNYIIEKAKTNLIPRKDHLIDQLARIGLYSRQLNTQELIQMLYSSYNPESFEGQKVTDTANYTTPLVQAKIQGDFMADLSMPQQAPAPVVSQNLSTPLETPVMTSPTPVTAPEPAPSIQTAPQSAPVTPTAPVEPTPISPEFNKTDLGFTTPPQMSVEPGIVQPPQPTPVVEPQTPVISTPVFQSPVAPVSPIAESPVVSVPEVKTETPVIATQDDAQAMLNQTVSQLGGTSPTPIVTPEVTIPVPQPVATATPITSSPLPKVGELPLPTNPLNNS